ncbi:MAG TPA: AAA family ATPase [Ktedonobacterales bacterium]
MWGRRQGDTMPPRSKEAVVAGRSRALTTSEELLRRAGWERFSDTERTALLSGYATLAAEAATQSGDGADIMLQDWVTGLVSARFQPEAAAVVRAWLADAPFDAHLFVGGQPGQGRRSLVASLARQAMASRPAVPDYCYVPDPEALDRATLLTLPHGAGASFAKSLYGALAAIITAWSAGEDAAAKPAGPDREQLISHALGSVADAAPDAAHAYLQKLHAALTSLAANESDLPFSADNLPLAHITGDSGAPVVVASLIRNDIHDLLLRANGGVVVLSASELAGTDGAWTTLATALRSGSLALKDGWPVLPLNVRVALFGTGESYNTLYGASDDFGRLFRFEAWCVSVVDWTNEAEAAYAALADGVAHRYTLPRFDASAVARLVEEGARRADSQNRAHLTTDLLLLRDLAAEAGALASARHAAATSGSDVSAALQRRRALQGVNARRVREAILTGQDIAPTSGAAIGQINGLGIFEFHPSEGNFAAPIRISATATAGRDERLVDIEHEARQADADHVRGAMTAEGYLAWRYGQSRPISLVARVRFEQEHGTTGGDSASGAVLFALLSALAQVPIRDSLSVTGAVGQYGEIQPIGGVNTKIEGFWELCRQRRAQGEQSPGGYGVLIPAVNARDLMLRDDVAESIASEGWFHIWPINTVDEGLPLLTGVSADEIHARVDQRLQRFYELSILSRAAR